MKMKVTFLKSIHRYGTMFALSSLLLWSIQLSVADLAYAASSPALSSGVIQNSTGSTVEFYVTGTSFNSFVSTTGYNADATDLANITYNGVHPSSAVIDEGGVPATPTKHITMTFPLSMGTGKSGGALTIAANTIKNGTSSNGLITLADGSITDTAVPILSEVTPAPSSSDYTPDYTFNSSEAGDIAYGGDCSSPTASATSGNNTVTFNELGEGTHSNCTITVTDGSTNASEALAVSSFTLGIGGDGTPPTLESARITGDNEITITFSEPVTSNTSSDYSDFGGVLAGRSVTGQSENGDTDHIVLTIDGEPMVGDVAGTLDIDTDIQDLSGLPFAGANDVVVLGGDKPHLVNMDWNDLDNSGTMTGGDTFTGAFSEAMNTSTINANVTDARFALSNGHTFGTVGAGEDFSWGEDGIHFTLTLGDDATITVGDTVNPTDDVTDLVGNPDNSSTFALGSSYLGEYWNLDNPTDQPDFPDREPDFTRTDSEINFNWGLGSPDGTINSDGFMARWTQTVHLNAGTYYFRAWADDGVRVIIDGDEVINDWENQDDFNTAVQTLNEGNYDIVVEYYEYDSPAHIQFDFGQVTLTGSGTSEDPYEISSCSDLQQMQYYPTAHFELAGNVDCSETANWNSRQEVNYSFNTDDDLEYYSRLKHFREDQTLNVYVNGVEQDPSSYTVDYDNGTITFGSDPGGSVSADFTYYAGFIPIKYEPSTNSDRNGFAGTLDGNYFNISDLYMADYRSEMAIFQEIYNAQITDLNLVDSYVYGYADSATLVGVSNGGLIEGITLMGEVYGEGNRIGGLVGANRLNSVIEDCAAMVAVAGNERVGGIAGANGGRIQSCDVVAGAITGNEEIGGVAGRSGGTVFSSSADASISGNYSLGGLVGINDDGIIANSHASGDVTANNDRAGGLVGQNSEGLVARSYSTGDVSGGVKIGGFAGANGGSIEDSYAWGDATGTGNVGGFAGRSGGYIYNSYSTGAVTGDSSVGGFRGYNDGGGISDSFWDTDTSGTVESNGGTGKTTIEMKDGATFTDAGWNFDYIWEIGDGTYPTLQQNDLYESGDGREEDPFVIANCQELQDLRIFPSAHFQLVGDATIDCSATATWNLTSVVEDNFATGDGETTMFHFPAAHLKSDATLNIAVDGSLQDPETYAIDYTAGTITFDSAPGNGLQIVGDYSFYQGFRPIGDDHNFTGVLDGNGSTIDNLVSQWPDTSSVGLFSEITDGAEIKDLEITDAEIVGGDEVGVLSGYAYASVVHNVVVTGASVKGTQEVGGLIGYNEGTVSDTEVEGTVSGSDSVGGMVGKNDSSGGIVNSSANVAVTGTGEAAGGLVGRNSRGSIYSSFATGNVEGNSVVGGLSGANGGTIENAYARGDVTGTDNVGGLSGRSGGDILNSYSTGLVTGTSDTGGLLGYSDGGSTQNSFWDINTSNQEASDAGTGKTTEEMQTEATFTGVGWDFDKVWSITADQYPELQMNLLFAGGEGTENSPYQISDCDMLGNIRLFVSSHFVLTHDVDCSATRSLHPNQVLGDDLGIGDESTTEFNLDVSHIADDHDVAVYVNDEEQSPDTYTVDYDQGKITFDSAPGVFTITADYTYYEGFIPIGFDSQFEGGFDGQYHIISNLHINRPYDDYIGLFADLDNSAEVSNVLVQGASITGDDRVGILVGENSGTVWNAGSTGQVHGSDRVGGLIGANREDLSTSFSTANVFANDEIAGGLTGANGGDIEDTYALGDVLANCNAGGLSGRDGGDITNSYSAGSVVTNDCNPGGLVGDDDGGDYMDSFWDMETSGQEFSDGGVGKATEDMLNERTYTDNGFNEDLANSWNFDDIWDIDETINNGYPYLQMQLLYGADTDPSVSTGEATDIAKTTVTLNGTLDSLGSAATGEFGFEYGTNEDYGSESTVEVTETGDYAVELSGLTCNTTYHYRAIATTDFGSDTGSDEMFTTLNCGGGGGGGGSSSDQSGPYRTDGRIRKANGNVTNKDGGVVSLGSNGTTPGVTIVFPPGAVDHNTKVTITASDPEKKGLKVSLASGQTLVGQVYELQAISDGQVIHNFNGTITITLDYDPAHFPAAVDENSLGIVYYNEETKAWETIPATVDPVNHTVTFTTTHFSIYAMVAGTTGPTPTAPGAAHPNGSLILDGKTVYLVKGQQRYGFRDPAEYLSYGYNWGQLVTATDADRSLPYNSQILKAMAGTLALDASDNRTVYMVGQNYTKRGFVSAQVFKALGYSFNNLPKINLADYPAGPAIGDAGAAHPEGSLVLDGKTVWWIIGNQKVAFTNETIFHTYGFSFARAVPANAADLALPQGPMVKFRDGTLVKDGSTVYVISDGNKMAFSSAAAFTGRGYAWGNVLTGDLSGYTTGSSL